MNTAGGNLPSADGAFERFLTAAIATIITIMFSWRLLTDVSDYDSASCLLATPPAGLRHLASSGRHESVDGDDEDLSSAEEKEEEATEGEERRKKKTKKKRKQTPYNATGLGDTKQNDPPDRFHAWGRGDRDKDLLGCHHYDTCLRNAPQHENKTAELHEHVERTRSCDTNNININNNNNSKEKTENNTFAITYGNYGDKPDDFGHKEVELPVNIVYTEDYNTCTSYLQRDQASASTCATRKWPSNSKTLPQETYSNLKVTNFPPLEVKKEVSSIRGGVTVSVTKANEEDSVISGATHFDHRNNNNNDKADTNIYWTSASVMTAMESVAPLQQVSTLPPPSTCVQGKSYPIKATTTITITNTTTTAIITATTRTSVNVDCPSSSSSTGTLEKFYHGSPMTTTPTSSSSSSTLSCTPLLSPGRSTTSGTHPPQQRDPRPKQPPPPPPPRKPASSTSGVINSGNADNNDDENRLVTSTNIPPKTAAPAPILGRRTLSNNNNKASFANRNTPSSTTASTTTTFTATYHPTTSSVDGCTSSTGSSTGVTPSLPPNRVEGGCNREFRDIIDDENFQHILVPTKDVTTSSQRTMSMSGFGVRGRYHQPRLSSYPQPSYHYDSDSDSESEPESDVFYFYGLEPIEEEDSDDLSSDSDHSVDYEVKGAFPSSISFDEHSSVDVDQLPRKRPPPLPPRTGVTDESITCARIPQLPVRKKGMSTVVATTTLTTCSDVRYSTAATKKSRLNTDKDCNDEDDDYDSSSSDSSSSSNSDSSHTTSGSYSVIKVSPTGSLSTSSVSTVVTAKNPTTHSSFPGVGTHISPYANHVPLFTVSDRKLEESCIDSSFASTASTSSAAESISGRLESAAVQHMPTTAHQSEVDNDPTGFSSVVTIDPSPVIRPPPFFLQKSVSKTSANSAISNDTLTTTTITTLTPTLSTTTTTTTTSMTTDFSESFSSNKAQYEPFIDSQTDISTDKTPKKYKNPNKPVLPPKPKHLGKGRSQPPKKVTVSTDNPVNSVPSPGTTVTARPLSMTVGDLSDTSMDLTTYNENALLNLSSPERSKRVKDDYVKPVTRAPLLLSVSQYRERSYSDGDVHTENSNIVRGPESCQAPFMEILESMNSSGRDRTSTSKDLPDDMKMAPLSPTSSTIYAKDSKVIQMYRDAQRSNAAENAPRGFTFSYTEETHMDYKERNYFMDNDKHESDSINNNTMDEDDNEDKSNFTKENVTSIQTVENKNDLKSEKALAVNLSEECDIHNGNIQHKDDNTQVSDIINVDSAPCVTKVISADTMTPKGGITTVNNQLQIKNTINTQNEPSVTEIINVDNYSPKCDLNVNIEQHISEIISCENDAQKSDIIDSNKDAKMCDAIGNESEISNIINVEKEPDITEIITVYNDTPQDNLINVDMVPQLTKITSVVENKPQITNIDDTDNEQQEVEVTNDSTKGRIIEIVTVHNEPQITEVISVDNEPQITEITSVDNGSKITEIISIDNGSEMSTDIITDKRPSTSKIINIDNESQITDIISIDNGPSITPSTTIDNRSQISGITSIENGPHISRSITIGKEPEITPSTTIDNSPQISEITSIENGPQISRSITIEKQPQITEIISVDKGPQITRSIIVNHEPQTTEIISVDHGPQTTEIIPADHGPQTTEIIPADHGPQTTEIIPADHGPQTTEIIPVDHGPQTTEIIAVDHTTEIILVDKKPQITEVIHIDNKAHRTEITTVDNELQITDILNASNDRLTKTDINDQNENRETGRVICDNGILADTKTIIGSDENQITYSSLDKNDFNGQILDNGPVILKRELSLNEVETTDTVSSWSPEDDAMDGSGHPEKLFPPQQDLPEEEEGVVSSNVCVLESCVVIRPPTVQLPAKAEQISISRNALDDSYSSGSENRCSTTEEDEPLKSNTSGNREPEEIVSLSVSNGANPVENQNKNHLGDVGVADTMFNRQLSNLDIDYEMFKMDCLSHSEDYASVYSLNKLGKCSSEGHLGRKPLTADSSTELDYSNNNNSTGEYFDHSGALATGRRNLSREEEEEIEDHLTDLNSDRFSPESRIYGTGRHYTSVLQRPLTVNADQRTEFSVNSKAPILRRKINATRNRYFSADNVSDIASISADNEDAVSSRFARHQKSTVRALKRRDAAKRMQLHIDTSLGPMHGLSASKSLSHLSQVNSRSKLYSFPEPRSPRPSYHEVHPDCILSPSNAEQLEESVRAASIDNLESCMSRYGSITSLVETDLDTGETVERQFSFELDVFEPPFSFQRSYFGKSASMMDLHSGQQQQQQQQQVRHSTGRGRFADRHVPKSKSMQALETNLDDDDEDDLLGESTFRRVPSIHELRVSRSLQKLNVPDWYKKSSVSRSGSCILNRDTDSMKSFDWRYTPSLTSSPASSIISQNAPVVIRTRVTPAYSRSLTTPMKAPKLTLPAKPANVPLPSDKFRTKDKPKGLMPIPIVPFNKIRDMFENKSKQDTEIPCPSPSAGTANIKTSPIKITKPEPPKRVTPVKRPEHEVTPQPKKSPISQGFSPALRIEEAIEETNEEEEEEEEQQVKAIETPDFGRNGVPAAHEFETIKGDTTSDLSNDHIIITNGNSRISRETVRPETEPQSLLIQEGDEYRIVEEAPPMIRKPIARRAVPSEELPEPSKKESPKVSPKPSSAKAQPREEPVEISRREELAAATPIKTVRVSDRIMQYDLPPTTPEKKEKERDWKPKLFNFRDSKQAKAPVKQTPPQPPPRPKITVPFFRSRKGKSDGASLNRRSPSHSVTDPITSTNPASTPSNNINSTNDTGRLSHIRSISSPSICTSHYNRNNICDEPSARLSNTNQSVCNQTMSTEGQHTNTHLSSDSPLNISISHSNVVSHNNINNNSSSSHSSSINNNNTNNHNNNNRISVLNNPDPDKCSPEKNLLFEFLQKPQYDRHIGLPGRPTSMEPNQSTLDQPNSDLSFRSPSQHSHRHHDHHEQQPTLGNTRLDSPSSSRSPSTAPSNHHHHHHNHLHDLHYYPPSSRHSFSSLPSSSVEWTTNQESGPPADLAGAMGYRTGESASTASLSRTDDLAMKEASLDEVLESLLALRN